MCKSIAKTIMKIDPLASVKKGLLKKGGLLNPLGIDPLANSVTKKETPKAPAPAAPAQAPSTYQNPRIAASPDSEMAPKYGAYSYSEGTGGTRDARSGTGLRIV